MTGKNKFIATQLNGKIVLDVAFARYFIDKSRKKRKICLACYNLSQYDVM